MASFAARRPVTAFWLLSVAVAAAVVLQALVRFALDPAAAAVLAGLGPAILETGGYPNLLTIAGQALGHPGVLGVFAFAAAPTLAALLLAWRGHGMALRSLLQRLRPVGPQGRPWRAAGLYGALLALYAAGFLVYDFVAGPGVDPFDRLRAFGLGAAGGAALGLFLDEGGTLEELGWRGYAFPLLQQSLRWPLLAALLVGVLHWAWHLPREVFTVMAGTPLDAMVVNQAVFLVLCMALAVVAGYCVNLAGGSVWPAVFVHGGSNVWSKALGEYALPSFGVIDLRTLMVLVLAVVIAAFAGRRLGRSPEAA